MKAEDLRMITEGLKKGYNTRISLSDWLATQSNTPEHNDTGYSAPDPNHHQDKA